MGSLDMLTPVFTLLLVLLSWLFKLFYAVAAVVLIFLSVCIIAHNTKEVALCMKALSLHAIAY